MNVFEDKFIIQKVANDEFNKRKVNVSFVPPNDDDALVVASSFLNNYHHMGNYVGMRQDTFSRTIYDCRITALHPLVKKALDHIETEAFPVSSDITGRSSKINVDIDLQDVELFNDDIKDEIRRSFKKALNQLDFKVTGSSKFRNWYIDGRQAYHIIVDENDLSKGIVETREIDVANFRKIRKEVVETVDGVDVITDYKICYVFSPKERNQNDNIGTNFGIQSNEIEVDESSVIYVTSGLVDETRTRTVSHIEPLIKATENLNMVENSHIMMRLNSAERTRVFYIDIGQNASTRADQIVQKIASKFKSSVEYDTKTGRLRDNRRFMSILNDMFIPRLSGSGHTTEIKTLAGDENIDKIKDIEYFRTDLIEKTIVPKPRLTSNNNLSFGKSTELSRDETMFHKQVEGLRQRFGNIFHEFVKRDLVIRNVMSIADYESIRDGIYFIFPTDNHYKMMLDFEVLDEKISRIQAIGYDPKLFFSIEDVALNICGYTKEEMEERKKYYNKDVLFIQDIEMNRQELEFKRAKEIDPSLGEDK